MNVPAYTSQSEYSLLSLDWILGALRRQLWLIAAFAATGIAIAVYLLVITEPSFTARANLLIEPAQTENGESFAATSLVDASLSTTALNTQVQILLSDQIANVVINKLSLAENEEFLAPRASVITKTLRLLRPGSSTSDTMGADIDARERRALSILRGNLEVTRLGTTYVISISYEAPSAQLAADLTNAFAQAYLEQQLQSKLVAVQSGTDWLEERLDELRLQVLNSDVAVQQFRADNNLITAGGTLISEQQLAEVSSQLIEARATRAQAEARWQRLNGILSNADVSAAMGESSSSVVLADLRARYAATNSRISQINTQFGSDAPQAVSFSAELEEIKRLALEELTRVIAGAAGEFEVAKARQRSLEQDLQQLQTTAEEANQAQVKLRELMREADSYSNLYQAFLSRYNETIQQQSLVVQEARVITPAAAPGSASTPKGHLFLALGSILGIAAGLTLGGIRELSDKSFRTEDQVRRVLGLPLIGMLDLVKAKPSTRATGKRHANLRLTDGSILAYTLDHPYTKFAETIRAAKVAVDQTVHAKTPIIIGVVSVGSGEGKSTVSANFAAGLAQSGSKTLLVDADFRNPELTRQLAPTGQHGFADILRKEQEAMQSVVHYPDLKLAFLPALGIGNGDLGNRESTFSGEALSRLTQLAAGYSYIVVDLAPLGPVVDASEAAPYVDAMMLVVEWGKTPRRLVSRIVNSNPIVAHRLAGAILNKVHPQQLKLYDRDQADGYGHGRYFENS